MALQGTLDTFALVDVLHLLGSTRKTGRLDLRGERGEGSVWLDQGEVVQAGATGARPNDAVADVFFELLRYQQGSFAFEADVPATGPSEPVAIEAVVTEAQALLAEWATIAEVVPSLDLWISMLAEIAGPTITITAEQWVALTRIGLGCTVRALADALDLSEIAVSRLAKDLVESGLTELGDVSSQSPPANDWWSGSSSQGGASVPVGSGLWDRAPSGSSWNPADAPMDSPQPDEQTSPAFEAATPIFEPIVPDADPAPSWEFRPTSPLSPRLEPKPIPSGDMPDSGTHDHGTHDHGTQDHGTPVHGTQDHGIEIPGFSTLRSLGTPVSDGDLVPESDGPATPAAPSSLAATLASFDDAEARAHLARTDLARTDLAHTGLEGTADGESDPSDPGVDFGRLTPQAARAIAMAAQATTEAERDAMLAQATDANDEPLDRGLLLRFLSSVKQ